MIQFEGPPLESFELEKESPPPEPSQEGDESVSPSSDSEDDTASSSSEESLSEGHSTEVPAKRDEWVESSDGGVGEVKGGADGFKPAPLGKRACRRLAIYIYIIYFYHQATTSPQGPGRHTCPSSRHWRLTPFGHVLTFPKSVLGSPVAPRHLAASCRTTSFVH